MISVIVPIYNAERLLHRCISSILNQSYTDFELILVNDGSQDSSGLICEEYAARDSRVRVLHKENGGVSSARNIGLENSRGEWVTFCDADDYVDYDWLKVYEDLLTNKSDIYIQGVNKVIIKPQIKIKEIVPIKKKGKFDDKRNLIVSLFCLGLYGYTVNKLFKKSLIDKIALRFDVNSTCAEDTQFVSQYLESVTSYECIDEAHYFYILPETDKKYGGNYYYSFVLIAKSMDRIYERELPLEICEILYGSIKDLLVLRIINGDMPDTYILDLYKRIIVTLQYDRISRNKILNFLILKSNKMKIVSKVLLKFIHYKKMLNI